MLALRIWISEFIDSLFEGAPEECMAEKFNPKVIKLEGRKAADTKEPNHKSIEAHARMNPNVLPFPRKTNMGKGKRGHRAL